MPKKFQHEDPKINAEIDAVYDKLDNLYVVSEVAPSRPRTGIQWFNPKDGTLKIWNGKTFVAI